MIQTPYKWWMKITGLGSSLTWIKSYSNKVILFANSSYNYRKQLKADWTINLFSVAEGNGLLLNNQTWPKSTNCHNVKEWNLVPPFILSSVIQSPTDTQHTPHITEILLSFVWALGGGDTPEGNYCEGHCGVMVSEGHLLKMIIQVPAHLWKLLDDVWPLSHVCHRAVLRLKWGNPHLCMASWASCMKGMAQCAMNKVSPILISRATDQNTRQAAFGSTCIQAALWTSTVNWKSEDNGNDWELTSKYCNVLRTGVLIWYP